MVEDTTDKGFDERQIVIFALGQEEFGVNISEVREIIRMEQITKIPNAASYIKGVINLRGGIIVVIDLAMKVGLPSKEVDKNTRIIVIEVNGNTVGMIVDSATEVLRLSGSNIEPAPAIITEKINADYIEGVGIIGERLLILLDLARLIEAKEIAGLTGESTPVESVSESVSEPVSEPSKESEAPSP
jgi:purine-binding chemotaxis protein CheW